MATRFGFATGADVHDTIFRVVDDAPDILYVVRPGEPNVPLKYSLRSLQNLPHRRVIVAGYCPSWVRNVVHVPVRRTTNKFRTIETNLRAALGISDLTDEVVYFNDDFFVMQPVDRVPVMHRGPAIVYKAADEQRWRLKKTIDLLGPETLSYDGCHVPLPLETRAARDVLEEMPNGVLWRTWYGNVMGIGGVQVNDVKSRNGRPIPGPFMSCSPSAIHALKHHLEDVLPRRNPYA